MAFIVLDTEPMRLFKKAKRYRNAGLAVVLADEDDNAKSYWQDLGRFGGTWGEVGDPEEMEFPKLYKLISAAGKLVDKTNKEVGRKLHASFALWVHDDVYVEDGKTNALEEYRLHSNQFPGSARGKSR